MDPQAHKEPRECPACLDKLDRKGREAKWVRKALQERKGRLDNPVPRVRQVRWGRKVLQVCRATQVRKVRRAPRAL